MKDRPRLLIEDWLPAAAVGVECMRERSTGLNPPNARLHVWWARRPLVVSRAAVLGSLLPADFPHDTFERLLGFSGSSQHVLAAHEMLERARELGIRVRNPHGERAFRAALRGPDLEEAHGAAARLWGDGVTVVDPMAGGGSIQFEAARMGFTAFANEYNPVACAILEATVDYPFRFGEELDRTARRWARKLLQRFKGRMERFYPGSQLSSPLCYIYARTVPCPDTGYPTPLVPDWHLLKPSYHSACGPSCTFAVPTVDQEQGSWTIEVCKGGTGKHRTAPPPTYSRGKGVSLFTERQIPAEYIKSMAQQGRMGSALYAVAYKKRKGLEFKPPGKADLKALEAAEKELGRVRPVWEKANVIPNEKVPRGVNTDGVLSRGMVMWSDMFSPRQLLCMGVLVEELRNLRAEIVSGEGKERGEAIAHLLACATDKFLDYNNYLNTWESTRGIVKHLFQRHDYAFKATFAEMAPCHAGAGLEWAIGNVLNAYGKLATLPRSHTAQPVQVSMGSSTSLPQFADGSVTAIVVDPPYADNVQYSELANFFYVWLKRTQGHRRPEWFSTYLCDHDEEMVLNVSRHRSGNKSSGEARKEAQASYYCLLNETFAECRRVLRDDGVLTVMFTHKKTGGVGVTLHFSDSSRLHHNSDLAG